MIQCGSQGKVEWPFQRDITEKSSVLEGKVGRTLDPIDLQSVPTYILFNKTLFSLLEFLRHFFEISHSFSLILVGGIS